MEKAIHIMEVGTKLYEKVNAFVHLLDESQAVSLIKWNIERLMKTQNLTPNQLSVAQSILDFDISKPDSKERLSLIQDTLLSDYGHLSYAILYSVWSITKSYAYLESVLQHSAYSTKTTIHEERTAQLMKLKSMTMPSDEQKLYDILYE